MENWFDLYHSSIIQDKFVMQYIPLPHFYDQLENNLVYFKEEFSIKAHIVDTIETFMCIVKNLNN